jgi:transcriptional regulator with XRE-family HTH domain
MSAAHVIREARLRAGLTQLALAAKAETTQSAIARWELGNVEPSHQMLVELVRICGFSLNFRLSSPIDATSLESNLALTPEQRLDQLLQTISFIEAGRASMRSRRG